MSSKLSGGKSKSRAGETGYEELRRAAKVLEHCRTSALDDFTAEEILNLVRACWRSGWDILPDALTFSEALDAAKTGDLTALALARIEKVLG